MTKRMSVREARANFGDVLGLVYYGNEPVIVEKKGKPVAVLISPQQWQRYQEQTKQRLAAVTEELWRENADKDPDAVLAEVTAVVEEVRQRRYDQQQP